MTATLYLDVISSWCFWMIFIREVLIKHGCTFSLRTYPDKLTRFRIRF